MNQETRYQYEKRIKELQTECDDLRRYRTLALDIFNAVTDQIIKNEGIHTGWIVKQYKIVFKQY